MYSYSRTAAAKIKPSVVGRWSPRSITWTLRFTIKVPGDVDNLKELARLEPQMEKLAADFISDMGVSIFEQDKARYEHATYNVRWLKDALDVEPGALILGLLAQQDFDTETTREQLDVAVREMESYYTTGIRIL